ncbi:hypothetical protein BsWGS_24160 [Bradybaena similaris]
MYDNQLTFSSFHMTTLRVLCQCFMLSGLRVEGEITFLAQGLLQQHSSSPASHPQARNNTVICFLGMVRTVHHLRSTGEGPITARCHLDSTVKLRFGICFQFAHTVRCHPSEI